MNLSEVLAVIQISLTFVLTIFILIIMLRQPLSPNLKLRFMNGKKLIECNRGKMATLSFHVENVGSLFAKPAAIALYGWVNFPTGFKPIEIRDSTQTKKSEAGLSGVFPDEGTTAIGFPRSHHLFYKEKWQFYLDVKMPQETKTYKIFIPVYHERGNCGTKVLKIKVV